MSEAEPTADVTPHRAYWPVVIVFGAVPNALLLISGALLLPFVLNRTFLYAAGPNLPEYLLFAMLLAAAASFQLMALFRREARHPRLIFWGAIVANSSLILQALRAWKHWFELVGDLHPPIESYLCGVLGVVNLSVHLLAQLLAGAGVTFTLRQLAGTILYLSLFCTLASGIVRADRLHDYQNQHPVAEHFARLGGTVRFHNWGADYLDLRGLPLNDNDLKLLVHLPQLESVNVSDTNMTDARLDYLSALLDLESLSIERTPISDAGLVKLGGLKKLQRLYVCETHITKEGIDWLHTQLPNCRIHGNPDGEEYVVGP